MCENVRCKTIKPQKYDLKTHLIVLFCSCYAHFNKKMEKEGNNMSKKPKKRFGLSSPIKAANEEDLMFKEYHQHWRQTNSSISASYAPIFTTFKDKHLKTLDGGPLKLYLYFAFAADNSYGNSWWSVEKIANFFQVQTRTIDKWIKVLIDQNLIYREQHGNKSSTTYLVPYSTTLIKQQFKTSSKTDDQKLFDQFVKKIKNRETLYGPIVEVFHLFQWNIKNGNPIVTENTQWLLALTKRNDEVLTCHYYSLKNSSHKGISEATVEDLATFDSPYVYLDSKIQGVALTHSIKLTESNTDSIIALAESIMTQENWDWKDYPKLEYGEVTEFFEAEKEEEKEENQS